MTADLVSICRDLLRKYHGAEFAGFVGQAQMSAMYTAGHVQNLR